MHRYVSSYTALFSTTFWNFDTSHAFQPQTIMLCYQCSNKSGVFGPPSIYICHPGIKASLEFTSITTR